MDSKTYLTQKPQFWQLLGLSVTLHLYVGRGNVASLCRSGKRYFALPCSGLVSSRGCDGLGMPVRRIHAVPELLSY